MIICDYQKSLITSFFSAYKSSIVDLIKYNLNESMKEKLSISEKSATISLILNIEYFTSPDIELK